MDERGRRSTCRDQEPSVVSSGLSGIYRQLYQIQHWDNFAGKAAFLELRILCKLLNSGRTDRGESKHPVKELKRSGNSRECPDLPAVGGWSSARYSGRKVAKSKAVFRFGKADDRKNIQQLLTKSGKGRIVKQREYIDLFGDSERNGKAAERL